MLKSLLLFLSVFLTSAYGMSGAHTHEINAEATKRAPLKIGETEILDEFAYIKFIGITPRGFYLVQEFYLSHDKKHTDPYLLDCANKMTNKGSFLQTCKRTSMVVVWYENGQKCSESNYQDGKVQGLWVGWHDKGQKAAKVHHQAGKRHGLSTMWHENGQKSSEGYFKDDQKLGVWLEWDKNGKETSRKAY